MSILKAIGLSKTYGKRQVVKSVSFEVQSGQTVGILGPNGAGKTTSFYMIIGLVKSDQGFVFLDDIDLSKAPMHERAKAGIGYLPQEASIFKKLTVSENIMSILQIRRDLNKNQRNSLLQLILQDFHIEHIKDSLGMSLSGGERRRVEIARTVAINPKFILFDEPFAGVDPIAVNDIRDIIQKLISKNIGVLITDHNVRETLLSCDYIYIVGNGNIIAEGDINSVTNNEIVKSVYLGKDFHL